MLRPPVFASAAGWSPRSIVQRVGDPLIERKPPTPLIRFREAFRAERAGGYGFRPVALLPRQSFDLEFDLGNRRISGADERGASTC